MKKLFATVLLIISSLASNAFAAGPYDGVYQYGLRPIYFSIHQNGSYLLVISLGSLALPENLPLPISGDTTVDAPTLETWEYSTGLIIGDSARVTGITAFRACYSVIDITFDNSGGATATLISYVNTPFGDFQEVSCSAVMESQASSTGETTFSLRRIF